MRQTHEAFDLGLQDNCDNSATSLDVKCPTLDSWIDHWQSYARLVGSCIWPS